MKSRAYLPIKDVLKLKSLKIGQLSMSCTNVHQKIYIKNEKDFFGAVMDRTGI